jgi:hypothetical protein
MKNWIILKKIHPLSTYFVISDIRDIAYCHPKSSMLAQFSSKKEADKFIKDFDVSGVAIELPVLGYR